jgi:Trypsin-like peptidase domain
MNWDAAIKIVSPHVVKIETPHLYGTGFLAFYNLAHDWCGIATAAHIVSHADEWQQPIRIRNEASPVPKFLKAEERVIYLDRPNDSAVVLFLKGELQLPESPIALLPMNEPCSIGVDVGWLGYPAIEPDSLCFFAGTMSARQATRKAYLVDGVAINGVSGGPVFHCPTPDRVQVIGCVTAYHANRATGRPFQAFCGHRMYPIFMVSQVTYEASMKQMLKNVNSKKPKNNNRKLTLTRNHLLTLRAPPRLCCLPSSYRSLASCHLLGSGLASLESSHSP